MHGKERISRSAGLHQPPGPLEADIFRHFRDLVIRFRNLCERFYRLIQTSIRRHFDGFDQLVTDMLPNRLRDLGHRFDFLQNVIGKPSPKRFLQRVCDLQSLKRIETKVNDNVGLRPHFPSPFFRHSTDMLHHHVDNFGIDFAGHRPVGWTDFDFWLRLLNLLPDTPSAHLE